MNASFSRENYIIGTIYTKYLEAFHTYTGVERNVLFLLQKVRNKSTAYPNIYLEMYKRLRTQQSKE